MGDKVMHPAQWCKKRWMRPRMGPRLTHITGYGRYGKSDAEPAILATNSTKSKNSTVM